MYIIRSFKNYIRVSIFMLLIFILVMFLAGCGRASTASKTSGTPRLEKNAAILNVVAAEDFYGEVAQAVGGSQISVQSIIENPATDPHDFEPTAQTAKAVGTANIVIYNGAGYDTWMEKLLHASSKSGNIKTIKVANDLLGKQAGDNEHVWYNPATMPLLANKMADLLSTLDPAHAAIFKNNAKQYIATLKPIQQLIAQLKQPKPVEVDTSEPVFDYMLQSLNYRVHDPHFEKAVDEGTDPSPKDIQTIESDIVNKKIPFFVENIQNEDPVVKHLVDLAHQYDVPVIQVTETEPSGKDYVQWMMEQLKQIVNLGS